MFDTSLTRLRAALAGEPLVPAAPDAEPGPGPAGGFGSGTADGSAASGAQPRLQPARPTLAARFWQAMSEPAAAAAAADGDGLLLGVGPHDVVQRKLAMSFRATWDEHWPGRPAPVAAVRGVFPGASRDEVAAVLAPDVGRHLPHHVAAGWARDAGISTQELLGLMNVQYGTPRDIVTSLEQDAVFGVGATHLVAAIQSESTPLLAALSTVTTHIGLVATASTTYNEPYHLARNHGRDRDHLKILPGLAAIVGTSRAEAEDKATGCGRCCIPPSPCPTSSTGSAASTCPVTRSTVRCRSCRRPTRAAAPSCSAAGCSAPPTRAGRCARTWDCRGPPAAGPRQTADQRAALRLTSPAAPY